jgi:hypothetical protein
VAGAAFAVMSDPQIGAVFELARCEGWRDDPEWIGRSLQPPISSEEAAAALRALTSMGALVPDDDGNLRISRVQWATGHVVVDDVANLAVDRLHRTLLARAPEVLDKVPTRSGSSDRSRSLSRQSCSSRSRHASDGSTRS